MNDILWTDCETGGTNHEKDALIQLSAIIEECGEVVEEIDLKIKPVEGKNVSLQALEVQGRKFSDLEKFIPYEEAYKKFNTFLSRNGKRVPTKLTRYIMGGYNGEFDCRFINEWYKDISGGPYEYWKYMQFSPIDLLPILRCLRHYRIISIPDTKLETCCNYFGIELKAHDSLSDIRATRQLTNEIMKILKQFKM